MNRKVASIHQTSQIFYRPSNEKNPLLGDNWFVTIQTNICYAKAILTLQRQRGTFGNAPTCLIRISAEKQNDTTQLFALQQRVNCSEGMISG